jgi:hypothetical protein
LWFEVFRELSKVQRVECKDPGFWVVYEWYPGEGFAVFIWFPELPGISSKCLEGVFMMFSSVPGVSGKYYTWVVVSGDL